jgi:hypothetical protein
MTDSRASFGAAAALTLALVAASVGLLGLPGQVSGQQKPTVPVEDYGKWESLSGRPTLSPDGRWLAYRLVRVNEESELRVKSLAPADVDAVTSDVDERVFVWGTGPVFSDDSRWLVWTAGVSEDERERLVEKDEPVRLGAGLLDLGGGEDRHFDEVGDFGFDESGRFLALHGYAPDEPEGKGADLRLVDLETGSETTFGNVAEYA